MNMPSKDEVKGAWKQHVGAAKIAWGKLTEDEFLQLEGHQDKLVGLVLDFNPMVTRRSTRAAFGQWVARLPTIGTQIHLYQLARLYRTVGMLLRSGMPAVTSMNMSSGLLSESLRRT